MSLQNIKLIVIEVDGCLTDGKIYLDSDGKKTRNYNVLDSEAIKDIIHKGYRVGLISSENTNQFKNMFKKWNLSFIAGKIDNKLEWVKQYIEPLYISLNQVAFMGFNLSDIKLLQECGYPVCPSNAHHKVADICKFVSNFEGGNGAIYEFLDLFNFNNKQNKKENDNGNGPEEHEYDMSSSSPLPPTQSFRFNNRNNNHNRSNSQSFFFPNEKKIVSS
jgi:3-deoxy-D-manno-octulosonate 8-phosphate phosphatase (KDO 8-P phosphatase)